MSERLVFLTDEVQTSYAWKRKKKERITSADQVTSSPYMIKYVHTGNIGTHGKVNPVTDYTQGIKYNRFVQRFEYYISTSEYGNRRVTTSNNSAYIKVYRTYRLHKVKCNYDKERSNATIPLRMIKRYNEREGKESPVANGQKEKKEIQ